jgi:hypothetical protein
VSAFNYPVLGYLSCCLLGLNPHSDTPVEVLHTVLLGFVKYFWHDVIQNQLGRNVAQKDLLKARLNSFNVSGLQMPPYAGSLTGRDFRAISQDAPFVLYDLVPAPCFDSWVLLSKLIPLIWQPVIPDIDDYIVGHTFCLFQPDYDTNIYS